MALLMLLPFMVISNFVFPPLLGYFKISCSNLENQEVCFIHMNQIGLDNIYFSQ